MTMQASTPRGTARQRMEVGLNSGTVLAAGALVLLPIAAIAALGIAPLGALIALATASLIATGRSPLPRFSPVATTILTALVVWACLSVLWSVEPDRATSTAVRLSATIVGGVLIVATAAELGSSPRALIERALLLGVAATVGVLLAIALAVHGQILLNGEVPLEAFLRGVDYTAPGLVIFNRTASVIVLLIWPTLVVANLYSRRAAIALLALTALLIGLFNSSTPVLALAVGAIVFAAAYILPRASAIIFAAGIVLITALSPALNSITPAISKATHAAAYVDGSFNHRLQIWNFVADRATERSLTGWGLEASRALGNTATTVVTVDNDGSQVVAELLPLHPHNALLQVWLELGLPGALLVGALLIWLIFYLQRKLPDNVSRAAAFATLASGLVIAELSYGIWQGWWQSALWLTAGFTAAVIHPAASRS